MKIDSEKVTVNANATDVFNFLKDTANIYALLPKDNVSDFQSDDNSCSFKVQGGIVITLVQEELKPGEYIKMKSGEKSPFPFDLVVHLSEVDGQTTGYLAFDGKINAFMKVMVQKPLTNLFNYMSRKLKENFEN
ncbi:MAG: hypothetical protein JJT77_02785 [Crocinitomicaceae bacterium]|nr:hypothetical protein [Crocinitomicaceae bacterium]